MSTDATGTVGSCLWIVGTERVEIELELEAVVELDLDTPRVLELELEAVAVPVDMVVLVDGWPLAVDSNRDKVGAAGKRKERSERNGKKKEKRNACSM